MPAGKSYRQYVRTRVTGTRGPHLPGPVTRAQAQDVEQLAALPVGQLARDELKREWGRRPDAAPGFDRSRSGHGVVAALRENDVLPGGA